MSRKLKSVLLRTSTTPLYCVLYVTHMVIEIERERPKNRLEEDGGKHSLLFFLHGTRAPKFMSSIFFFKGRRNEEAEVREEEGAPRGPLGEEK